MENHKLIGKVAILSDSACLVGSSEILKILQNKNIDTNLIIVPKEIKALVDSTIWQNFSRVFIHLDPTDGLTSYLSAGYIQGLLDLLGIDYTGSNMLSVAVANDRIKCKKIWQIMGIATTHFVKWWPKINWQEIVGLLGFPMAVKSIYSNNHKIFKITNMDQLQVACKNFSDLNNIIIEPWITGDEYSVYIIGDQVLLPLYMEDFKDPENKNYNKNTSLFTKKLNLNINIKTMQNLAINAFKAIGGNGVAKVNIIQDLNNDCWVSSIDTSPLIIHNSTLNVAASNSGISFELLVEKILMTSFIKKHNNLKLQKIIR